MSCRLSTLLPYPTLARTMASVWRFETSIEARESAPSPSFSAPMSLTTMMLCSSTSVMKSFVLDTKRLFTSSMAAGSFLPSISMMKTILLACSMWSFRAVLYISTTSILPRRMFCMKLLRSNLSMYDAARLRTWQTASRPTMYESSAEERVRRTYSRSPSTTTLKKWHPESVWLSAGDSANDAAASPSSSSGWNVAATRLPFAV